MLWATATRAVRELRDVGTATGATRSLGPRKRQPRATGRRELKCRGEVGALRLRPPNAGSSLRILGFRRHGARRCPRTHT